MVVMALPSPRMVFNNFRQSAIVVWNLFPLALTAIVHGAGFLLDAAPPAAASRDSHRDAHLRVVHWLGAGAMTLGFAMHVGVSAVSI
ncbi:hypothetical protein DL769_010920 [Monosporascus sp. CRB-8-3]|nr:hypothetical protein DL769_010920 [Monosporascus sp. CRB-8-3]